MNKIYEWNIVWFYFPNYWVSTSSWTVETAAHVIEILYYSYFKINTLK